MRTADDLIGAGLAAQGYGAGFFESGGHPTAIVKSDTELSADEAMAVKEAVGMYDPRVKLDRMY